MNGSEQRGYVNDVGVGTHMAVAIGEQHCGCERDIVQILFRRNDILRILFRILFRRKLSFPLFSPLATLLQQVEQEETTTKRATVITF